MLLQQHIATIRTHTVNTLDTINTMMLNFVKLLRIKKTRYMNKKRESIVFMMNIWIRRHMI